jgi:sialate O-acetylesterase
MKYNFSLRSLRRMMFVITAASASMTAQPRLAGIFGDRMVLQRDKPVNVWGWDAPATTVRVSFAGQSVSAVAAGDSSWMITLSPMAAGGPYELIATGSSVHRCTDIYVGEVWLASGQSNMEFRLDRSSEGEEAIASPRDTLFRLCTVPRALAEQPQKDGAATWVSSGDRTTGRFSAVAYWFGRMLRDSLRVPVGIIHSSWGGTAAEGWMPREALEKEPAFRSILERWEENLRTYPEKMAEYQRRKPEIDAKWLKDSAEAIAAHRAPPARPAPPKGPGNRDTPTGQWNAMIHPWLSTTLRGFIWYQGEANATRATQYRTLFPALIQCWRDGWKDSTLPFYFVQLPNLERNLDLHKEGWPDLRDAQLATINVPYTGMTVTIDVGDPMDLHPRIKRPVGERLARLALHHTYGWSDVVPSGPLYAGHRVEGSRIRVSFAEIGEGLRGRSGADLNGFLIAAEDRVFRPAMARIDGDDVVVWREDVTHPAAVRYAWAENPEASLLNVAGLPASPFRTDIWKEVSFGPP